MANRIILITAILILFICCTQKRDCKCPLYCDRNNLAINNGNALFPSALETSDCTDRKLLKYFIVDGIRYNEDEELRYIEFTGGPLDIIDSCGLRCATIDFGQVVAFNQTILWFLKDSLRIDNYAIQYWCKILDEWKTVKTFAGLISTQNYQKISCPIVAVKDTFATVSSSKIRFITNNCTCYFKITEFEVYLVKP